MDNNVCAPGKYDAVNNTCFSLEQVIELASAYNRYVSKSQLNPRQMGGSYGKLIVIKNNSTKKYLLSELHDRFKNTCGGNELCLTKQAFMNKIVSEEYRDDIINRSFRPVGPNGSTEWLSNSDIDQIMYQYEEPYANFKFMGAVPSDCDKHSFCSLYSLDFDKFLNEKKEKLGIVFNHDVHGQPGSHWVGMYIDILKGHLYYCDSAGGKPKGRINKNIDLFREYYKNKTGKDIVLKINTKSYQKDSSECGIYSCCALINFLSGISFEDFIANPLNFKEINTCRNAYFSNIPTNKKANKSCDPAFINT